MTQHTITLNRAQTAFLHDEVLGFLSMQDYDNFADIDEADIDYLKELGDMIGLLAQVRTQNEGTFTLSRDTADSLCCYVDDEESFEDYLNDGMIGRDDLADYRDQLDRIRSVQTATML